MKCVSVCVSLLCDFLQMASSIFDVSLFEAPLLL